MSQFEELRWKKFPVLDDGFVCLVDWMGNDAAVTQAARCSYGKDLRAFVREYAEDPTSMSREEFVAKKKELTEKAAADDRTLLRYMMRHRHATPFEMCEVKLLVRVPMDCWRQWIRHRAANVNEYSTRYSLAIDAAQTTSPDGWRCQATDNKQGSSGQTVPLFTPEGPPGSPEYDAMFGSWPGLRDEQGFPVGGDELTFAEARLQRLAREVYQQRIDAGVAREQARKDLPLSTYTEAYWKCDLRNLLHFLGLRMDSHAQLEIRQYATIIGEQIVKPLFPESWQAFLDYQFMAMTLSAMEQRAVAEREFRPACLMEEYGLSKREVGEFLDKCEVLKLLPS